MSPTQDSLISKVGHVSEGNAANNNLICNHKIVDLSSKRQDSHIKLKANNKVIIVC